MMSSHILLVDDDPNLLDALSEALRLRMDGLEVDVRDSAPAALECIRTTDYDAVVADIKMPEMDGLELLAEIGRLRPETPTLLITGHGDHDLAVQALRGGAHDYVQKPIDRDYFVASLRRAIERHQLSQQLARQRLAVELQMKAIEDCAQDRAHDLREFFHREQQARAELDEVNRKLEQAHRQREEFIAMVAHELGNPLTVVLGYAEALGDPHVSREARERARTIIVSETRRMARLVDDLADVANLAAGRFQIQPILCDLTELVREQAELARATTDRHTICLDAPPEMVLTVCDRERVAQVLSNLLANAIKYADDGEIWIRLCAEEQEARLSVSDEGPGIPKDHLETIFDSYVRLKRDRCNGGPNGTGLGLHIARGIVEAHGGRIWIDSIPDHGATFHIGLPLAPTAAAGARQTRTRTRR
jgi:two-component system, sensor histidine kinase and response regulator